MKPLKILSISIGMVISVFFITLFAGQQKQDLNLTKPSKPESPNIKVPASSLTVAHFGQFPLHFIPNQGQVNAKARFYAKTPRYTLWLTKQGLVFDSFKRKKPPKNLKDFKRFKSPLNKRNERTNQKIEHDVSRLLFIGAKKDPQITAVDGTSHKVNYFIGNDKDKWRTNIQTSKAVLYKEIYKNIDLKVYGLENQIEYDWIVKPGGNPEDIRFEYKNVKGTHLDDNGNLIISTRFGNLIHKKPVSYQMINNKKVLVNTDFKNSGHGIFQFKTGKYDKNHPLIIDPLVLVYATYLGGGYIDDGHGISVDNNGFIYITGETISTDFPTLNQYQLDSNGSDAFIAKINSTLTGANALIYSTYLGGGGDDIARGIAVDNNGIVFITGGTASTDFPVINQYQTDPGDNYEDVFVAKINTNMNGAASLMYSTYIGGDLPEEGYDLAIDANGFVYITGYTMSTNYPIFNQYQADPADNQTDVFITKLDTNQAGVSSLLFSSYLGGNDWEVGNGITSDSSGNAYITGTTSSPNFPTINQFQTFQGFGDAYVTKIDTTTSGASCLLYSTYLGTTELEHAYAITIDNNRYVYVTGFTDSPNFPKTSHLPSQPGWDASDVFLVKIDTLQIGTPSILFSTCFGGESREWGLGINTDQTGNVLLTGFTDSTNFPVLNEYQGNQPRKDGFIAKINTNRVNSQSLVFSSYLGGNEEEVGRAITSNSGGEIFLVGWSNSTNFPTRNTIHPNQGNADVFVAKLRLKSSFIIQIIHPTDKKRVKGIVKVKVRINGGTKADLINFYIDNQLKHSISPQGSMETKHTATDENVFTWELDTTKYSFGEHTIRVTARDNYNQRDSDEMTVTVDNPPTITITQPSDNAFLEQTATLKAKAEDDDRVKKVEFWLGDILILTDYQEPYASQWDTLPYTSGPHILKAIAYDSSNQKSEDQIKATIQNLLLTIQARKIIEKSWLIKRYAGQIDMKVENRGSVNVTKYILYKKIEHGGYAQIKEFSAAELSTGSKIYFDMYLNKDKTYTYLLKASDSQGQILSISNEATVN